MKYVWIVFLFAFAIFAFYMAYRKYQMDRTEKENIERIRDDKFTSLDRKLPSLRARYQEEKAKLQIPENCDKVSMETTVFGLKYSAVAPAGSRSLLANDFYIWSDVNGTLTIFPTEDHIKREHIDYRTVPKDIESLNPNDIPVFVIPKDSIEYYNMTGTEKSETNIHTDNAGTNIKGAIIGGLIAGDAGAIIGSQHNRNKVYSTTRHIDERCVELFYKLDGKTQIVKLGTDAYSLLEKWYPEKSYGYVVSRAKPSETSAFDEIKKFKELLDSGIITQDEFDAKKKELLNL